MYRQAVVFRCLPITVYATSMGAIEVGLVKAVSKDSNHDESQTVGKEEYQKLEHAVVRCHPLSDSFIYIKQEKFLKEPHIRQP